MKIRATFEWKDEANFPGVTAVLRSLGAGAMLRLQGKIEGHVSTIEALSDPYQEQLRKVMDAAEETLPTNATPEDKEKARTDAANTVSIPASVMRKIEMARSAIDHEYLRAGLIRVDGLEVDEATCGMEIFSVSQSPFSPCDNLLEIAPPELTNAIIAAIKGGSKLSDAERKNSKPLSTSNGSGTDLEATIETSGTAVTVK